MMHYLLYLLTVIGVGYFITQSSLVKPIRMKISKINAIEDKLLPFNWFVDKLDGVINCIYCASFWIGLVVYFVMFLELNKWTVFYAFSAMGAIYVIKNLFSND
jgi:hypothetical protein